MLTFNKKETQALNYYWFENEFSDNELEKIKEQVSNIDFLKATIQNSVDESIRNSSIKWIPFDNEFKWIYQKLMKMAEEANSTLWDFDLISAPEMIQYTEYYDHNSGKYDWHQDIGDGIPSLRKISITVQLSDPSEYEGGELQLWGGGESIITAPKGKGNVVIFPSYMMHRITPVTKGTRTSFVLWLGGEHYK